MCARTKDPKAAYVREGIYLTDIDGSVWGNHAAQFHPLGYPFKVVISPIVITRLVQWAKRNKYIIVDGTISYPCLNRRYTPNAKTE